MQPCGAISVFGAKLDVLKQCSALVLFERNWLVRLQAGLSQALNAVFEEQHGTSRNSLTKQMEKIRKAEQVQAHTGSCLCLPLALQLSLPCICPSFPVSAVQLPLHLPCPALALTQCWLPSYASVPLLYPANPH